MSNRAFLLALAVTCCLRESIAVRQATASLQSEEFSTAEADEQTGSNFCREYSYSGRYAACSRFDREDVWETICSSFESTDEREGNDERKRPFRSFNQAIEYLRHHKCVRCSKEEVQEQCLWYAAARKPPTQEECNSVIQEQMEVIISKQRKPERICGNFEDFANTFGSTRWFEHPAEVMKKALQEDEKTVEKAWATLQEAAAEKDVDKAKQALDLINDAKDEQAEGVEKRKAAISKDWSQCFEMEGSTNYLSVLCDAYGPVCGKAAERPTWTNEDGHLSCETASFGGPEADKGD